MLLRRVATGATLALVAALVQVPAQAAARPDLVVTSLRLSASTVRRGATAVVHDTTRNVGTRAAAASVTGYFLSKDRSRSSGDKALGVRGVGTLRPGAASSGQHVVTIPAATAAGRWYLLACADSRHALAESNEGNNCRAVPMSVTAGGYFPQVPHPMAVTPTFGTGTLTGGYAAAAYTDLANNFTVTGPDGSTYAFDIPAGAVAQSLNLTVTPVTGLAGAPTTLAAGVRIQPTGLRLLKNATLTITPATALASGPTAFRFYDGGADAGMFPIDHAHSTASKVVLSIGDLATYAVGASTTAQRATALAHPPTRTEGQFDNVVATLPTGAAARPVAARTGTPSTQLAAADDYYDHVIKPALVAAETNDTNARQAVTNGLAWGHEVQVLGADDTVRIADLRTEMFKVLSFAVAQEYARCKTGHQLLDLGRLLANARTYAVLGAPADADNTFAKAQACGRFTFSLDDTLTGHQYFPPGQTGRALDYTLHVGTQAPILMQLTATGAFQGTGTIVYKSASYSDVLTYQPGPSCTLVTTTTITATHPGPTDGVKATLGVDLQPNVITPGSGVPVVQAADGVVYLSPLSGWGSYPSEDFHNQDSGCSSAGYSYTDQMWAQQFHDYPGGGSAAPVIPLPASAQNGATIFSHTYLLDNGGAGDISNSHDTESATVTVTHVPQ